MQGPGIDLSAVDHEVLFVKRDARSLGELHEVFHEVSLRQKGDLHRLDMLLL